MCVHNRKFFDKGTACMHVGYVITFSLNLLCSFISVMMIYLPLPTLPWFLLTRKDSVYVIICMYVE